MKLVAAVIAAVVCVALVLVGQQQEGWGALGLMLVGLAGLLVLIGLYNRRYR